MNKRNRSAFETHTLSGSISNPAGWSVYEITRDPWFDWPYPQLAEVLRRSAHETYDLCEEASAGVGGSPTGYAIAVSLLHISASEAPMTKPLAPGQQESFIEHVPPQHEAFTGQTTRLPVTGQTTRLQSYTLPETEDRATLEKEIRRWREQLDMYPVDSWQVDGIRQTIASLEAQLNPESSPISDLIRKIALWEQKSTEVEYGTVEYWVIVKEIATLRLELAAEVAIRS